MPSSPQDGVIVGSDATLEWLLLWWWKEFKKFNPDLPITFIDFGMTATAIDWCREHGNVIPFNISMDFIEPSEQIDPKLIEKWKKVYIVNPLLGLREKWFKKPFAMTLSPYKRSIWLDLDCQVRGDLTPMFEMCRNKAGFAIAPEPEITQKRWMKAGLLEPGEKRYNGGVVVYSHDSEFLTKWTQAIVEKSNLYPGDSSLIGHLLLTEHLDITELPSIYNWRLREGFNPDAVIIHWVGDVGKKYIKQWIGG